MFTSKLTRRVALPALGAMILVAAAASPGAFARARVLPVGIHVDVEPLRANAGEPTASWLAEAAGIRVGADALGPRLVKSFRPSARRSPEGRHNQSQKPNLTTKATRRPVDFGWQIQQSYR